MNPKFIFIAILATMVSKSFSQNLVSMPIVEAQEFRYSIEGRSVVWTSPYDDKNAPVRNINSEINYPVLGDESLSLMFYLNYSELSLGRTDFLLGESQIPIETELKSQAIGLGVRNENKDLGTLYSLYVSYMSASNNPYENSQNSWFETTASYFSNFSKKWRYGFLLNYSRNRGVFNDNILPMVGVAYKQSPSFEIAFGFPFFRAHLHLIEIFTSTLLITPVGFHFNNEYIFSENMVLFNRNSFQTRGYLHTNRSQDHDRLFYEEVFSHIGFKRKLSDAVSFGMFAGLTFERKLYEAEHVFGRKGQSYHLGSDYEAGFFLEYR